jgi:hypothetical protein
MRRRTATSHGNVAVLYFMPPQFVSPLLVDYVRRQDELGKVGASVTTQADMIFTGGVERLTDHRLESWHKICHH